MAHSHTSNKVLFVFTKEAAEATSGIISQEEMKELSNADYSQIQVEYLGEEDTAEVITGFAESYPGIFLVAQNTEEGVMVNAAKKNKIDIMPASDMPHVVKSWANMSVI